MIQKQKNFPKKANKPSWFYLLSLVVILALVLSPIECKVKVKTSDFRGINTPKQSAGAQWPLGHKIDMNAIFDLSEAKNPVFSVKNIAHGVFYDTNTKISESLLFDIRHILHRYAGNHIGLVSTKNQLILIETKDGGNFGETITLDLFDSSDPMSKAKIACYDLKYLRNYDAVVLGCLDDPFKSENQYFWVYHFDTRKLVKTIFPQTNQKLRIECFIADAQDGIIVYLQGQSIPSFEYLLLDKKTYVLTIAKVDPDISSTIDYSIDSLHHAWLLKDKVWTRTINMFQSNGNTKTFTQYEWFVDKHGNYNIKALTNTLYNIQLGSASVSSNNLLTAAISDDGHNVLKYCKGNPRNPAATFWYDCKTLNNFSTGIVDLIPTRSEVTNRGDAIIHYRTWPRESEGGAKLIPTSDTPLQPLYDQITVAYNLNDIFNYTANADNIYNYKPTMIEQRKDMTTQFLPNLNLALSSFSVTIEVVDDDNKASQTFNVNLSTDHGQVTLNRSILDIKLKANKGVANRAFGAIWKGNLLQDKGLTMVDESGKESNQDKVRFNYQGKLNVILNGNPLSLGANDRLYINIPYSVLIKEQDPSHMLYYKTVFDGGETFSLSDVVQELIPKTFTDGDYFCLELVCTMTSNRQYNAAIFFNGRDHAVKLFSDGKYSLKQQHFSVLRITQSLYQLQFLRNELMLTPFQSVYAYHAYSFKQNVVDNVDYIFEQNSGILSSFCPRALTYISPYNLDVLFLLSYCDTDFSPRLIKIQYNTLSYKVLDIWNLNIPPGMLKWTKETELCNLNWEFSPSADSKFKNGINTSILLRHGDTIFEINPHNGYDVSVLDLSLLNGQKKASNSKFLRKENAAPTITKFQCLQGAAIVEFSNKYFGVITPTLNGPSDWQGKFRATGTDLVSGSATLVQNTMILAYRSSATLEMKYLNLGEPSLIYDLTGEAAGSVVKLKGQVSNGDHTANISVNISVQSADEIIVIDQ